MLPWGAFLLYYSRYYMPRKKFPKEKEHSLFNSLIFVVREGMKADRKYAIANYVVDVFQAALNFVEFGAIAIIINEFAVHGITGARTMVLVWAVILLVLSDWLPSLLSYLANYISKVQSRILIRHLANKENMQLNALDIGTVESSEFQNMLDTVNNRGSNAFFNAFTISGDLVLDVTNIIVAFIAVAIISPFILLVIIITAIPTYFIAQNRARLMNQAWVEYTELRRSVNAKNQLFYNKAPLIEVKNFGIGTYLNNALLTLMRSFHARLDRIDWNRFLWNVLSRTIITIGFAVSFVYIILKIKAGMLSLGSVVFLFGVISRFQGSLRGFLGDMSNLMEYQRSLSIFIDFFELTSALKNGSGLLNSPIEKIEFQNVSFKYPTGTINVLHNINLTIDRGDHFAIVGLNGAGKTTFIKLVTRVYDVTSGVILINGKNIKDYDMDSLKKQTAILFQDYSMHSEESIKQNIQVGDISYRSNKKVEEVATVTHAKDFIMELPKKYDQKLGTEFRGGVELSKGQKQKVALARALYRKASFVILDEPTAAVDAVSEDSIFKALLGNKQPNQILLVISHKFSNVREADKILVIGEGTILEEGSHDELMTLDREYAKLFNLQAEGYR